MPPGRLAKPVGSMRCLITDGERTAGPDPCGLAKRFRKLHVVLVGRRNVVLSREMARLGKGLWSRVERSKLYPDLTLVDAAVACRLKPAALKAATDRPEPTEV